MRFKAFAVHIDGIQTDMYQKFRSGKGADADSVFCMEQLNHFSLNR